MLDGAKEQQRAEWRDWGSASSMAIVLGESRCMAWIQERCEARGQTGLQLVH